jgi:hypothetical protein
LARTFGEPIGEDGALQQLIVLGMGKLGGGELNVSSDVDLVFVYPKTAKPRANRSLPTAISSTGLANASSRPLHETTADGYVFRVDMRLRPYGESGPLSVPFSALEQYLVTQGRAWERYAWLKARPLTGSRHDELDALVIPFVFRKYLDFDAYDGLRDIHRQIREQGKRSDYEPNIKLGPGGIREIEFTVQALQIVRGGREPDLRVRGTLTGSGCARCPRTDAGQRRGRAAQRLRISAQSRASTPVSRRRADTDLAGGAVGTGGARAVDALRRHRCIRIRARRTSRRSRGAVRRRVRRAIDARLVERDGKAIGDGPRDLAAIWDDDVKQGIGAAHARLPPGLPILPHWSTLWTPSARAAVICNCRCCRGSASTRSSRDCSPLPWPNRYKAPTRSAFFCACWDCSKPSAGAAPIWRFLSSIRRCCRGSFS